MPVRRALAVALVLVSIPPLTAADPTPEQIEFFETKVRPVLVEHCYKCHSEQAKAPKGGLRVDGRGLLLKGGDNGPVLVPDSPEKSRLIEAIRYKNPDLAMPPKGKLPDAAVRDLEAWVKAGAPWPGDAAKTVTKSEFDLAKRKASHWSWKPVEPRQPPAVKNTAWPTDPIDRFILTKLEEKSLTPAAPADRLVWLRRVTFALTGLPPAPAEIEAFQKSGNREAVVDRLLALPHFGERWGRHWLDLVRYAESRGHEFDPDIPNAYQYRDYVVRAFNANVPYDQFVREHLAGDVLPEPRIDAKTDTNESIIGTAFWHLGEELHSPVDIRQDQADRLDNRIDVFSKAFLGLTVACARCHDHKFDAISTKDYYALYGLLEGSSYRQVRIDGWTRNREVAASRKTPPVGREAQPNAPGVVIDYANLRPDDWRPDDVTFGDGPHVSGGRTAAVFDRFWANLKDAPGTQRDHGPLGAIPRSGLTIRTPTFVLERGRLFYFIRGAGTAYAAVDGHTIISGPLHRMLVKSFPNAADYRWVEHDLAAYKGQRLHVELTADPKTDFAVAMVVQADTAPPSQHPGELAPTDVPHPDEAKLAAKVKWESRLAPALWDGNGVDETVFVRGNPKTPGEVVPHRSLEVLAGPDRIAHSRGSGRLELAVQLTDPARNPFIARIAVNRTWHHLFGRGLVASTDNFGVLGEVPSHPELLDYLATEFVRDGWSTKRLIRRLVLSSSYCMSSKPDAAAEQVDPVNLLLHHFRLKRLEGEAIRDAMLAVSGRLDPSVGGPPVPIHLTPFLDGRGKPVSGPLDGNGRRSLYLAVRRNFLSPFLQAFDTPIPFSTVGRRQVSNVPAQALILMNDPFIHQQAEVWAKRLKGTTDEKLNVMYLSAFGRPPTDDERTACAEFVKERSWADLAHALFNVKEFVFVQ